mgnify:FL=1
MPPIGVDPSLITIEEAAVRLGKSTSTVWRLIRAKKLTRHDVLDRTLVALAEVEKLAAEVSR